MDIEKKIIIGFSGIVLFLLSMAVFAIYNLQALATLNDNLYKHPFTVSNATKNIDVHLTSMHRYMKDVVLATNEEELQTAINKVAEHEKQIFKDFSIIFERFLGNKEDILKLQEAFVDWKSIRQRVILLKKDGRNMEAAAITKGEGAEHLYKLNEGTKKLIAFAEGKAAEFYTNAQVKKQESLILLAGLAFILVTFSVLISSYVIRTFRRKQKERQGHLQLINQHIYMSSTTLDGKLHYVSNALCRFLGYNKEELLGSKQNFFLPQCHDKLWNSILSGSMWSEEVYIKTKNEHKVWVKSTIYPVFDKEFNVTGFDNIIHDMSDKKALQEISITDKLTSLHNRRYFDEILGHELMQAHQQSVCVTLAIIDIDFFKNYNDTYGHPAGDKILQRVAIVLKEHLKRSTDYVFRLGGEEFGILYIDANTKKAIEFLHAIKEAIEALKIEHKASEISSFLTISIGAKVLNCHEHTNADMLYLQADEALYKAKEKRNTVQVF